jgi:hypothetical protein
MTSLWEVDGNILNKGVQGKLRRGRMTIKNPAAAGCLDCDILRQGSGVTPDSGETVLRSRTRPNYGQLPAGQRRRETLPATEIICLQDIAFRNRIQPARLFSSIASYRFGGYFGLDGDLPARTRNAAVSLSGSTTDETLSFATAIASLK